MKLNLHTIQHELGTAVSGSHIGSNCTEAKLDYPILFTAGDPHYFDHIVYVATSQCLEGSHERIKGYLNRNPSLTFSCLCVGVPPDFCFEAPNCDLVWTDPQRSMTELFNAVQQIFQRFDAWERELDTIIELGGSLPDLVNASLKVFKNDLCVTDPFSRVLAHRIYQSKRLTPEQTNLIKEGEYLPKDMMLDGIEDEQDGENFTSFKPTFSTMNAFQCTVLRSIIDISSEYSLILSVHPNFQQVGEKDCAPALVLAKALKKLGSASSALGYNEPYINAHSTLKALVQGKQVSDAEAIQCAIAQGWNRDIDEYLCFCIDFIPSMNIQDCCFMRPYVALCNRLEQNFDCLAFVLDGRIVAVANLTHAKVSEIAICASVESFAQDFRLVAGASAPYCGLRSLPGSYRQAFAALRAGYTEKGTDLVRFGDRALAIGMNFIMKEMTPERFCPRPLVELAQQNHELYEILETYLKANCNANVASKQLDLPRNSFVYKLEKAKKVLGIDLDDSDNRLLLLIALKLIDLYGLENLDFLSSDQR